MTMKAEAYRLAIAELTKDLPARKMSGTDEPIEISQEVRDCFRSIKINLSAKELATEREKLKNHIKEIDEKCREVSAQLQKGLGDFIQLKNLQRSRAEYKRKLQELSERASTDPCSVEDADRELQALLDLPQVINVYSLEPDLLVVTVLATYEYKSTTFHLGTWDVYIGSVDQHLPASSGSSSLFRTYRAVESRYDPESTGTGFYNYPDGSFCFGANQDDIRKYLRRYNYLHAMQMIIQCMCWLGPTKIPEVEQAFMVYRPTGE